MLPTLAAVVSLAMLAFGCSPDASHREPAPAAGASGVTNAVTKVVVVSIDGLMPRAIRELGREGTPNLHRLIAEGASTLNARTERELTITLPNHTGMVTGRRISAAHGGHGVT